MGGDKISSHPSREIASIQALRALAALSVVLLHTMGEAGAMNGTPGISPWPSLASFPWEAGVDLFFIISGFVMVYSSRELFGAPGAWRLFLGRRIARILPIYWGVTTLFLIVALVAPVALDDPFGSWRVVIASYFFLPWQRPDGAFLPVFRLGWTLNYEMLFYVIFAGAIRFPLRQAIMLVSAILMALVLFRAIHIPELPQLMFWGDPIVIEFIFGMLIGWIVVTGGRIPPIGLLIGAAGLITLAANPVALGVPRWLGFGLPVAALVLGSLRPVRPSRLLSTLGYVGSASYAIYLTHLFVARAVREVWIRLLGPAELGLHVGLTLVSTVAISLLVYNFFEVPTTRSVRRLFGVGRRGSEHHGNGMKIAPTA